MTHSPLAVDSLPHHNKYSKRTQPPNICIPHHWAGTTGGDTRLTDPKQQVSANYIIYTDGRIITQVPEQFRPWTTGNNIDDRAITIEIQNTTTAPNWEISPAALNALTNLLTDIAQRYNWQTFPRTRLTAHKDHYPTQCPGNYIYTRLNQIAETVNQNLTTTTKKENKTMYTTIRGYHYTRKTDNTTIYLLMDTSSGWYCEHQGTDGAYNTQLAQTLHTGTWIPITEDHATAFKTACQQIQPNKNH